MKILLKVVGFPLFLSGLVNMGYQIHQYFGVGMSPLTLLLYLFISIIVSAFGAILMVVKLS